jgi:tetratricopeptide (TPR) repeat protein
LKDLEPDWPLKIWQQIYHSNQPEQAVVRLNRIIRDSPSDARAWALKANALNRIANQRKDWQLTDEALRCAERAIELDDRNDLALTNKGWALIDLGRFQEGLRSCENALEINPGNVYAWYNKAWAHYLMGEKELALNACKRALDLEPANPILRRGLQMFEEDEIPKHLKKWLRK